MRVKAAVALSLVVVFLTGIAVANETGKPAVPDLPFEKYLPDSTIFFASITNVVELRNMLSDPKLERVFELAGIDGIFGEYGKQFVEEFVDDTGMHPNMILDALKGDITIAFLESDSLTNPAIIMMADVDPESFPFGVLLQLAVEQKGVESVVSHEIAGVKVEEISGEAVLALAGDRFLITSNLDAMKSALAPEALLSSSPLYLRNREKCLLNNGVIIYANVSKFLELIQPFMPPPDSFDGRNVELFFEVSGLRDITSVSGMVPFRDGEPGRFFIHAPEYKGLLTKFFSTEPIGLNVADNVPADYDAYFGISMQKPIDMFNTYLDLLEQFVPNMKAADVEAQIRPFEEAIGISLKEDLISPMGTVVGAAVKINADVDFNFQTNPMAILELFQFNVFMSLDNADRFLMALHKLALASGGSMLEETYNGADIFVINVPILPFSLDFAVFNNNFYFTLGTKSMKSVVDMLQASQSMSSNSDYINSIKKVPENAWYIAYHNDAYLPKIYRGLFTKIPSFGGIADSEQRDELIEGILDYIGEESGGLAYSVSTGDGIYCESWFSLRSAIGMIPLYMSWFSPAVFPHDVVLDTDEEHEGETLPVQ